MKKIVSKRTYELLFNLAVGLSLPIIVTFFITMVNNGFNSNFFPFYIKAYITSSIMSIAATYLVMPLLQKTFSNWFEIRRDGVQ